VLPARVKQVSSDLQEEESYKKMNPSKVPVLRAIFPNGNLRWVACWKLLRFLVEGVQTAKVDAMNSLVGFHLGKNLYTVCSTSKESISGV